jgi:UDPglucose 6-dehydrogenase
VTQRLTVLGTGYLGATHAVCMAELGFEVLGMDVDAEKVETLSAGGVPFYEPGLEPLLRRHLDSGRLRFTTSYEEVAAFGDVHFVCVGTPPISAPSTRRSRGWPRICRGPAWWSASRRCR